MNDGYGIAKPTILARESWDGKVIPTEPNALSDYLKGVMTFHRTQRSTNSVGVHS